MGVLNVTPDSFSDGGRFLDVDAAVAHGLGMARAGADVLDVGGESTRPGATPASFEVERERVVPVVKRLADATDVPLSVDTYKAPVAHEALAAGAAMVNDVTALRGDAEMAGVVARAKASVVLMHMLGEPRTMQQDPRYGDVVREVRGFIEERVRFAVARGIPEDRVLVDPGIGFGKALDHNLALLRGLAEFRGLGAGILIGCSRKSFLGKILGTESHGRLEGSLAAAVLAAANGVDVVRVHDVPETVRALAVADAILGNGGP